MNSRGWNWVKGLQKTFNKKSEQQEVLAGFWDFAIEFDW